MEELKFDYELLDCGNFRRLERFGSVILDRPCPVAHWKKKTNINWDLSNVIFTRSKTGIGKWEFKKKLPENWNISLGNAIIELRFSSQNQVGVFPEQIKNWQWMSDIIKKSRRPLKILNLFAY